MEPDEIKADTYEAMAAINRAFQQLMGGLRALKTKSVLSDDYVQDQEIIASDLWAKINTHILSRITERETDDRNHYGKMRATLERRIRGRQ